MAKQVRRFMTFLFAAAHVVANVVYSAAYAAGAVPARAASSSRAPATPAPTGRKAYYEAERKASGDIAGVLSKMKMTPAQRLAVRNYIGQAHGGVKIVSSGSAGGVTSFAIKNAKNGSLLGRIGVSAGADGSIIVNKSTAADLDFKKSVNMPVSGKVADKDARAALGGSQQLVLMEADLKKPAHTTSLPGLNPIEGLDFANARQCTARFNRDGSGYEYCLVSKPTALAHAAPPPAPTPAKSGNKAGTGKQSGSGGAAVKVIAATTTAVALEGFVNYFSRPSVDKGGRVNRSVLGGHYTINSTMTQVQQQGSASTASVDFSPNLDVPVQPEVGIPEGGEAEPEEAPEEQTAAPQPEESEQPEEQQQDEAQPGDEGQPEEDQQDEQDQGQQDEDQQDQDQQDQEDQQDLGQQDQDQQDEDQQGDEDEDGADEECGGVGIPGLPGLYLGGPRCEEPNALQHQMEEEDYEKAIQDGSPEALQTYLKEHPDSDQAADVLNLLELGAAGESYTDFDNSDSPENTTPSEDTPYN